MIFPLYSFNINPIPLGLHIAFPSLKSISLDALKQGSFSYKIPYMEICKTNKQQQQIFYMLKNILVDQNICL